MNEEVIPTMTGGLAGEPLILTDGEYWTWGDKPTSVCRVAGKRKDGLYTLRVDRDMLQRIADEFGVEGWDAGE